jgi:hypothetical protein
MNNNTTAIDYEALRNPPLFPLKMSDYGTPKFPIGSWELYKHSVGHRNTDTVEDDQILWIHEVIEDLLLEESHAPELCLDNMVDFLLEEKNDLIWYPVVKMDFGSLFLSLLRPPTLDFDPGPLGFIISFALPALSLSLAKSEKRVVWGQPPTQISCQLSCK